MILYDFSQIIHNNIYQIKEQMRTDGLKSTINILKHKIITHVLSIATKYKKHSEIVLCCDSRKKSWREGFHPHYKGRRKLRRKDDDFPWKEFWGYIEEFQKEIDELFPFNIIECYGAEGDDVIGTLTNYIRTTKPNEEIIIVSNDKDFKQLHITPLIKQYDPREKKEIRAIAPKNDLIFHILKGDDSDDIPNVKTTDLDTFINPNKKTVRMWFEKVVWEHIENNTVMDELLQDIVEKKTKKVIVTREQLLENFKRNKKLVDLRECPIDIQKDIVSTYEYNKEKIPGKNRLALMKFFIKNKMRVLTDRVSDFDKFYNIESADDDMMSFLNN